MKHAICVGEHDSSSLMPTRSILFHTDDSKCVWEECLRNPICLYHYKTTINTTADQYGGERTDQKLCSVTNKDPMQTIRITSLSKCMIQAAHASWMMSHAPMFNPIKPAVSHLMNTFLRHLNQYDQNFAERPVVHSLRHAFCHLIDSSYFLAS